LSRRPISPSTQKIYDRMLERAFGTAEPQAPYRVPATVDKWPESCRALLRAAIKHRGVCDGVDCAPALAEIPIQWQPRRVVEAPIEEELQAYEAAARKHGEGKAQLAILPLAMGLRAQELLQMKRSAVERSLKSGDLVVMRKGGEEQALPMKHARDLLVELLEAPRFVKTSLRESPLKSRNKKWDVAGEILSTGAPITQYHALHALIRRVGVEAGMGHDVHPHLLRHGCATRMARDGAPMPVIQWFLNHKNIATTMLYVHPAASDAAKYMRPF